MTRYDRFQSIIFDANFISELSKAIPFPTVPNERCGSWYLKNIDDAIPRVYFKSTDGHYGKWSFNKRRMNLWIIEIIIKHKGVIIVDSTQRGKKIPDALSKTIPIWCCVINRYIMMIGEGKRTSFDGDLYTPPGVVSRSEHDQISKLIPGFLEELMEIKIKSDWLMKLDKPLRAIWITPESRIIDNWKDFPFYPIVCVTASGDYTSNLFNYIKGAADDQESWGNVRTYS
jgi:tRNA A64-2'-O-ribosylphosphate transferase